MIQDTKKMFYYRIKELVNLTKLNLFMVLKIALMSLRPVETANGTFRLRNHIFEQEVRIDTIGNNFSCEMFLENDL